MDYLFYSQIEFILKRGKGVKACLFDSESKQIISNLIPLSQFQDNDFFYFDYITNKNRTVVEGMECVVIVRPSSLKAVIEELACPFYGTYIIIFTSQIDPFSLEILANADLKSIITEVHEINADLFKQCSRLYTTNSEKYKRVLDGLSSVVLSLEISPNIKVFDESLFEGYTGPSDSQAELLNKANDKNLKHVGRELKNKSEQYNFQRKGTFLLLGRNFDLVTPLVYDWQYQAMIYEHLEADNSLVKINQKEFSLNDTFFSNNKFVEIATVGENIKETIKTIDKSQLKLANHNFEDVEESILMKSKMECHLNIYNTLISECLKSKSLSEYENEIICSKEKVDLKSLVGSLETTQALKLLLVYFLKWIKNWDESSKEFPKFRSQILKYQEIFKPRNFCYKNNFNNEIDIKLGYISPLRRIIKHVVHKKLKENALINVNDEVKDVSPIIIYIEGGVTMREYREAMQCEQEYKVDIVVVGTEIINSSTILKKIL